MIYYERYSSILEYTNTRSSTIVQYENNAPASARIKFCLDQSID